MTKARITNAMLMAKPRVLFPIVQGEANKILIDKNNGK